MKEKTNILYELGFKLDPVIIIPLMIFAFFIVLGVILPRLRGVKKSERATKICRIIPNIFALFMIAVSIVMGVYKTVEYKTIMDGSKEENVVYAEGMLTEYTTYENGFESFSVGETKFSFDPNRFDYGYNVSVSNGSVLKEGQKYKIGYTVYKGQNKIVYIEFIPEETAE